MGIVSAIARVRAGAKNASLEGALASLGAQLKSGAIPERLRGAAGRLASLLGTGAETKLGSHVSKTELPTLEHALDAHASMRANAAADAVCPFTGLRADEMLAPQVASPAPPVAQDESGPVPVLATPPALAEEALMPVAEKAIPMPLAANANQAMLPEVPVAEVPVVAPREFEREHDDVEARGSAREPNPEATQPVIEVAPPFVADEIKETAPQAAPTKRGAPDRQTGREKRKETLAGERPVANTSGRSATRPAAKRPRNGAEGTRKKK